MYISALFITCLPDAMAEVTDSISKVEGVELQMQEPSKIILTLEAEDEREAEIKIYELEQIPHVVAVQLTGFVVEP